MCKLVVTSYEDSMFEDVYRVEVESFRYPYSPDYLSIVLALSHDYALVALCDNNIVGYIVAVPLVTRVAHIASIAVKPGYRRMKIGSALLQSLEELLEADGFTAVFLETWVSNTPAHSFYLRHGYRPFAVVKNYYPWGEDAILYYKLLGIGLAKSGSIRYTGKG